MPRRASKAAEAVVPAEAVERSQAGDPAQSAPADAAAHANPLMTPAEIDAFFRRLAERNPEPRSDLRYTSPFELLVAVVLSAQATDVSVNKVTPSLFASAPTPAAMVALGEEGIRAHIRTIGLFNAKARNLLRLCEILEREHGGAVPRDRAALEALPGVGRKSANVVLNCAFGEPTIAVDTHIFRVGNRTGLAPGKTVRAVEDRLEAVVPEPWKRHAHHWLILHGRYLCKARKPACPSCPVADLCRFPDKTVTPTG